MAGHFQTARGRFVVVNGYFPKGSGPDRDNSRVGYKLDFSRTVFTRAQALRRRGPGARDRRLQHGAPQRERNHQGLDNQLLPRPPTSGTLGRRRSAA